MIEKRAGGRICRKKSISLDNKGKLLERVSLYREHGHDREKAMRFICEQASPFSPPVLEIGCGKGLTALELTKWSPHVICLDISGEELSFALQNTQSFGADKKVSLIQADGVALPFYNDSFQTVFMINAIHHIHDPSHIFKEAYKVLSMGGLFVIADFTQEGFHILDHVHSLENRKHSRFYHTIDHAVSCLTCSGFNLI
ncbi:class I SAM-dependent methyltransferase, partial [bacterium]|nr:class I SAM-dependent methyltransferase [bacterium]